MGFENAVVRINPDGSVAVFTGTSPHGQGSETTLGQIVADTFGIPLDRIEVSHGDTKDTPYGQGTYGSRSAAVGGSAVKITALSVKDKIKQLAAHMLEAAEADMEMADGQVFVKGVPNRSVSFEKVARTAYNPANCRRIWTWAWSRPASSIRRTWFSRLVRTYAPWKLTPKLSM